MCDYIITWICRFDYFSLTTIILIIINYMSTILLDGDKEYFTDYHSSIHQDPVIDEERTYEILYKEHVIYVLSVTILQLSKG